MIGVNPATLRQALNGEGVRQKVFRSSSWTSAFRLLKCTALGFDPGFRTRVNPSRPASAKDTLLIDRVASFKNESNANTGRDVLH